MEKVKQFKPLDSKGIEKLGRLIPWCGICMRKYIQCDEFEWTGVSECCCHKIARIGAPKPPKPKIPRVKKIKTIKSLTKVKKCDRIDSIKS